MPKTSRMLGAVTLVCLIFAGLTIVGAFVLGVLDYVHRRKLADKDAKVIETLIAGGEDRIAIAAVAFLLFALAAAAAAIDAKVGSPGMIVGEVTRTSVRVGV
jgi:hypothetical protein